MAASIERLACVPWGGRKVIWTIRRTGSERKFVEWLQRPRSWTLPALFLAAITAAGCASRGPVTTSPPVIVPEPAPAEPPAPGIAQPPATGEPGIYVEQGIASWYGVPFHGRRAANGEIFDMNTLVAAHRTLPFGSILRVTNLANGRQVEVRVIDRGPFVRDRVLDLARAAAIALDMLGTGTAPVRIELLAGPSPAVGDFTVQVGAFSNRANAEHLRERLIASYQPIFIQGLDGSNGHYYRVLVGRVSNSDTAQQLAMQLRSEEGLRTFVMRLDVATDLGDK